MSIKRMTRKIFIETHKVTIIRTNGNSLSAHCDYCLKTVSIFSPEQVAAILQIDLADLYHRIETGELHLTRTTRGIALVCGSVFQNRSNFAEVKNIIKGDI